MGPVAKDAIELRKHQSVHKVRVTHTPHAEKTGVRELNYATVAMEIIIQSMSVSTRMKYATESL